MIRSMRLCLQRPPLRRLATGAARSRAPQQAPQPTPTAPPDAPSTAKSPSLLLITVGVSAVTVAGAVFAANQSPTVHQFLSDNIPGAATILSFVTSSSPSTHAPIAAAKPSKPLGNAGHPSKAAPVEAPPQVKSEPISAPPPSPAPPLPPSTPAEAVTDDQQAAAEQSPTAPDPPPAGIEPGLPAEIAAGEQQDGFSHEAPATAGPPAIDDSPPPPSSQPTETPATPPEPAAAEEPQASTAAPQPEPSTEQAESTSPAQPPPSPPPPTLPSPPATAEEEELGQLNEAERRIKELEAQLASQAAQEAALLKEMAEQLAAAHKQEMIHQLKKQQEAYRQALAAKVAELKAECESAKAELEARVRHAKTAELHEHLRVQEVEYASRLKKALSIQAQDIREESEARLRIELGRERAFRIQRLERLFLRLKAAEAVVTATAERDAAVRRLQRIFLACQNFGTNLQHHASLSQQMATLARMAEDDVFVATLIAALPPKVVAEGVDSERELIHRFAHVKHVCRQLAFVPEYGGLLSYVNSYLTAWFTPEPHGLVEGDGADAVLARAEYFVEQRDLDKAAREINQLRGPARDAAQDWLEATRSHLEVAQMLEAIRQYVGLMGLGVVKGP